MNEAAAPAKAKAAATDTRKAATMAAAPDLPPPAIKADDLQLREFKHSHWVAIAPRGLPHDELENPGVWSFLNDLKPFDKVDVISGDNAWFAEVLITDAVPGSAQVKVLRVIELPRRLVGKGPGLPPGFDIRRADVDDKQGGWIIERLSDGVILGRGLPDFEAARRHLMDHSSLRRDKETRYV